MTLVDAETGALEREIEIVPGRMIVWANGSLSHKVDVVDAGTPRVMLGVWCVHARARQCFCEVSSVDETFSEVL